MYTASEILQILTEILTTNYSMKLRIRNDYDKFKTRMSDTDARQVAAIKYLRSLISNDHRSE